MRFHYVAQHVVDIFVFFFRWKIREELYVGTKSIEVGNTTTLPNDKDIFGWNVVFDHCYLFKLSVQEECYNS